MWVQGQLASSGPHSTKWAGDQRRPTGLDPLLVPDLLFVKIPTIIGSCH